MDISNFKLIRMSKVYLRKKDVENASKKRQENIKGILKALLVDKTTKESILLLQEITEQFNTKLDEKLKRDLESVQVITAFKKLKK